MGGIESKEVTRQVNDGNLSKSRDFLKESVKKDINVPGELKREYTNVLERAEHEREPNVVEFLKKNEIDFYDYLKNRVIVEINKKKEHIDSLRVMTPIGLLSSLESYASNEKNNKDVAQWFHDQREALDNSSKKKPSSDWTQGDLTGDFDDNGLRKHTEGPDTREPARDFSKKEEKEEVRPAEHSLDKKSEITTTSTKPESKFRKLMRKALKKIWDVMKRPIKFVARKTLDGIAFPYHLARLMAKGTWHEMRKHPVKFTAVMVSLTILCSAGMVPYFLWLARHQHQREKQAREGTQLPPEKRSWPALAHQLKNYDGRFRDSVNGWGDSMLRSYGRLGGKDLNWEDPKKKESDGSQDEGDSKKDKKSSKTNKIYPSQDMPGEQDPQGQTPPKDIPPSTPEGSQTPISIPKEKAPNRLKIHKDSWRPGWLRSWFNSQGYNNQYNGTQPYNQYSSNPWQSRYYPQ